MNGAASLQAEVAAVRWYHSIDLGDGLVTPGTPRNAALLERGLPDLAGRSVLDIGAWDGLYSFEAERRGARRVVALDHYAWLVDFDARNRYWADCEARGVLPDPRKDLAEFARPDTLPGRRGFDLARRALGSRVEPVVGDFMEVDPAQLGRFEVVLFLGVLYHLRDPLPALERVRELTDGVAVVETEAIEVLGAPGSSILDFTDGDQLRHDHTNWFVPTRAALHAMCRTAGFARVETRIGPPTAARQVRAAVGRARDHLRRGRWWSGERRGAAVGEIALQRYRVTVHAFS